jgi:ParB-like nuclease domain
MPKPESFPIDKIYVPVKRKKALKPDLVQEIAESILEIGQQAPILVRPDEDRFVLVEGLHRFEACKALGETTVIGLLVSGEVGHQKMLMSHNAETEAARDKMTRLKRLRLEKEAAERLTAASSAAGGLKSLGQPGRGESAELPRKRLEKDGRNNLKVSPSQLNRRSGSTPTTLLDWLTQQKRDGGRY